MRYLFFIFLIPVLAQGAGGNVFDFGARLAKRSSSLGLPGVLDDLRINPGLLQKQILKRLEEAMDDPLKLVEVDPKTGPDFNTILESDVFGPFFFSRLDLSNEKQMKRLAELLDQEAELYPHAFRAFWDKTDIESLTIIWEKFMNALKKGIQSHRLKPGLETDLQAALLSVFKKPGDTGLPLHYGDDLLGMYNLHPNRVVRSAEESLYFMLTPQMRAALDQHLQANGNIPGNVTSINRDRNRLAEILGRPYVSLMGYDVKPHALFHLIVWGGEFKPGRYRYLPDINAEEGVKAKRSKTPYQYTEEEIQKLTEIYTNPHFRLNPNDVHWDEIAVPVMENPSSLSGSREVVLKVWEDLEWIEVNRWNRDLWDKKGSRYHVMELEKTILEKHIVKAMDDFIGENDLPLSGEDAKKIVLAALGEADNVFIRSFMEASAESEGFRHFFDEILESFFDESL